MSGIESRNQARCQRTVGNGNPQARQTTPRLQDQTNAALCADGTQKYTETINIRGGLIITVCRQPCNIEQDKFEQLQTWGDVTQVIESNSASWNGLESGSWQGGSDSASWQGGSGFGSWQDGSETVPLMGPNTVTSEPSHSRNATIAVGVGGVGVVGGGSAITASALGGSATAGGSITGWGLLMGAGTAVGLSVLLLMIGAGIAMKSQRQANQRAAAPSAGDPENPVTETEKTKALFEKNLKKEDLNDFQQKFNSFDLQGSPSHFTYQAINGLTFQGMIISNTQKTDKIVVLNLLLL